MALLRLPMIQKVGSTWERLCETLWSGNRRSLSVRKPRRLLIDSLEERQLLSVSPVNVNDVLINQNTDADQYMLSGKSVATDHNGDFVAVWTRYDHVYDTQGNIVIDQSTGMAMTDANIYARYFTDSVQRLTINSLNDLPYDSATGLHYFYLKYNGNEVQQLEFSCTTAPFEVAKDPIVGTFSLWLDVNGDGIQDADEVTAPIDYNDTSFGVSANTKLLANLSSSATTMTVDPASMDAFMYLGTPFTVSVDGESIRVLSTNNSSTWTIERDPTQAVAHSKNATVTLMDPAAMIQKALRDLGGSLADVEVEATDGHTFNINFGDASNGLSQPTLQVVDATYTSGFLAAGQVTKTRTPGVTVAIPVSSNMASTAQNIEYAFQQTSGYEYIAPVFFPSSLNSPPTGPYTAALSVRVAAPEITVTAISATQFDLTFTGNSGKQWQPVLSVLGASGQVIDSAKIEVIKETSDEFRVNDPEPDDPSTLRQDFYDQYSAQVAMSPDGDFVITWTGVVPNSENYGSVTDIFARRFTPSGYQADATQLYQPDMNHDGKVDDNDPYVQGVLPVGSQFRVNTVTTNAQGQPTVGMDAEGNFVVAWASQGQDLSYFNSIRAQRFDRDGAKVGSEFLVNTETTTANIYPYLAMAQDGVFAIAWENTNDPIYIVNPTAVYGTSVLAKVYSAQGSVVLDEFFVSGGGSPTVAFDTSDRFVITWDVRTDKDNLTTTFEGVYGQIYELFGLNGNANGQVVLPRFRVNSANLNPTVNSFWPFDQYNGQAALDADGDLTVAFEGFGPDSSQIDVDRQIEQMLIIYKSAGMSDTELGEMRASLESYYGLLRGEAYGALFSQFDSDPQLATTNVLSSDNIANNNRDGQNTRVLIDIDPKAVSGNFKLKITIPVMTASSPNGTLSAEATITPAYFPNNGPVDPDGTIAKIHDAISALSIVGVNWLQTDKAYGKGPFEGPIAVRRVPASELAQRKSSTAPNADPNPWDPALYGINTDSYVYEITFQGELHDEYIKVELVDNSNTMKYASTKTSEVQQMIFSSSNGLPASGQFTFSIGSFTSGAISFDSSNMASVAAQVQNQLNAVYPGAVVTNVPGGPPWVLQVTFAGDDSGVDQPLILANVVGIAGVSYVGKEVTKGAAAGANASAPHIATETYGDEGTFQYSTSMSMTPDGSFVQVWSESPSLTDPLAMQSDSFTTEGFGMPTTNFYYREFAETADTAGPMVTRWTTAEGTYIKDSQATNVTEYGAKHIVVTFDEQMYDNASHTGDAVTNPKNYKLYRDGVEVAGAIFSVEYGLNKAAELSGTSGYEDLNTAAANRWEAVITFDGNGTERNKPNEPNGPALSDGVYTLVALAPVAASASSPTGQSGLRDKSGNALGRTGYVPSGQNYIRDFTLLTTDTLPGGGTQTGTEILVNQTSNTDFNQTISQSSAAEASENNRRAVAMDHYGDFAVVWTSYGQDGVSDVNDELNFDPNNATAGGIYVRVISRNNVALTNDVLVNTHTKGDQINGTVAMDADGDFVVVWASQGQDADGSWGIYGQRFNAIGQKVGGEFQVNTLYTNDQVSPSVAMDSAGNFVVVWATKGQSFSYFNEVHGQSFDHEGNKIGNEFRVNSQTIPGSSTTPSANNLHPTVAISDNGNFVVAWDVPTTQQNGVTYDSVIMARLFDRGGTPIAINGNNAEFQANVGAGNFLADPQHIVGSRLAAASHRARNAQVAMDSAGNFIIVWEAMQDNDVFSTPDLPDSYGIYFRRFAADGTPQMATDEQANLTVTALVPNGPAYTMAQSAPFAGDQLNPSIAMDADGDFTITWDGNGAKPDATNPTNLTLITQADTAGVFIRSFHAYNDPQDTVVTEAVSVESRVNLTQDGEQAFASVAMTPKGDRVVVWSGNGIQDSDGIFARRYAETSDTAGPIITNWFSPNGTIIDQDAEVTAIGGLQHIVVAFDEEMYDNDTHTGDAVTNPANYRLLLNGVEVPGAIVSVAYGENMASKFGSSYVSMGAMNRWEAVLTISSGGTSGAVLTPGSYTIEALAPVAATTAKPNGQSGLRDKAGNPLGYSGFQTSGAAASRNLTLVTGDSGGGSGYNTGVEFPVNQTTANSQTLGDYRTVAADHSGDFAVVWTGYGAADSDGVYVRLFSRDNVPLSDEILVNTTTTGSQTYATIAMDADGDFVVVWTSQNQVGNDGSWDVFAQRFDSMGRKLGGEVLVNTTTTSNQVTPSVAMDSNGRFVVAWASGDGSFNYGNNIYAQSFDANGNRISNEVRINTDNTTGFNGRPNTTVSNPVVALSDTGRFVVSWFDVTNQVNGVITDGQIVARMFTLAGAAVAVNGSTNEFLVSVGSAAFLADAQHTPHVANQSQPAPDYGLRVRNSEITMDREGRFIIAWEAYQDNDVATAASPGAESYGIYFRRFNADGTAVTAVDEQANLTATAGPSVFASNQLHPSLAMTVNGQFTIVWDGSGGQPDATTPMDATLVRSSDSAGVWQRSFLSMPTPVTAQESVGVQSRVNTTQGDVQQYPSIAMTPSGSTVVAWSGKGYGDTDGIFARRFASTTSDTVGPMLTGYLMPDGTSVINNVQVTQAVKAIVVTFDEDMFNVTSDQEGWEHSVTNPKNYDLLYNGEVVSGGISQVLYGLDIANLLGSQYGLNIPKLNKYQAVLIVDANGPSAGVQPLTDGSYQVVAWNSLEDKAGNPLLSTGPAPDGSLASGTIRITIPTGQETKVGSGYTSATTPSPVDGGQPAQPEYSSTGSTAADANGDYVVVWTDNTTGHQGVWARLYKQTNTLNSDGTRTTTSTPLGSEFLVSADLGASNATVARDTDGDFVVSWSTWNSTTNWDVYARQYNALGASQGDQFRVNSTTADAQRYSSVGMDALGNFVITWQSYGQDGSGYGIYAQCFDAAGNMLGGANETQVLSAVNGFVGTFRLQWDDDGNSATPAKVTAPITFNGNAYSAATLVQNALAAIGAETTVSGYGLSMLLIEFTGKAGAKNQSLLTVTDVNQTGGNNGAQISVSVASDGSFGEFRVNDTTKGDQTFPDVAVDATGNFVVTWTSAGQNGDGLLDTNVYAKRFSSAGAVWAVNNTVSWLEDRQATTSTSYAEPLMTTVDDPANHIVTANETLYQGVVQVIAQASDGTYSGSGSLLAGTDWILTAAHVVWSEATNLPISANNLKIAFDLPSGRIYVPVTQVIVNPGYTGDASEGYDIALVELAYVPTGVQGYQLYTGSDEVGQVASMYGYGITGTGTTGAIDPNIEDYKRTGYTRFDATGDVTGYLDTMLVSDFDDGTVQHDAFGWLYGIHDTGLGVYETSPSHGDSGGPLFLGYNNQAAGKIAGIVSFGNTQPGPQDITKGLDQSFGEFVYYVRVSSFSGWINSITTVAATEFIVNGDDALAQSGNDVIAANNRSGSQSHSSVAMDASGDFVIAWTSYGQDGIGSGSGTGANGQNGVYARRYSAGFDPTQAITAGIYVGDGSQASGAFQVNQVAGNNQQNPQVAMDADGDFMITWESKSQDGDGYGIYARRYARTSLVKYENGLNATFPFMLSGTDTLYNRDQQVYRVTNLTTGATTNVFLSTDNGAIGGEIAVNVTKTGNQRFPGITMDSTGDAVIVWSGYGNQAGQTDSQGIYFQRFARPDDDAGPTVGGVYDASNGGLVPLADLSVLDSAPGKLVITFGEQLSTVGGASGSASVLNPANWLLTKDGVAFNGISSITYGYNATTGKYEAVVTFDGESLTSGIQSLPNGRYILTLRDTIEDIFGNQIDGDYNGEPGTNLNLTFTVAKSTGGDGEEEAQLPTGDISVNTYLIDTGDCQPDVATDANGNFVVVWKAYSEAGTALIEFQQFNRLGQPLDSEYSANTTTYGERGSPAVAMDSFGNFVIVWAGVGSDDQSGIYAQIFDKNGYATGTEFRINQYAPNAQNYPDVAMDANGNFIVTWTSYGQDGDRDGVYARKYSVSGAALTNEFLANTTTKERQDHSVVSMSDNGSFVVVWESWAQDGGSNGQWGIYGQRFNAAGSKVGGEFQVNTTTLDKQMLPAVAMDATGDFAVAWQSMGQDGSGYGVYARRYTAAGTARDAQEFRVNSTTLNYQWTPDIGIADNGDVIVTWAAFGTDNVDKTNPSPTSDFGIYSRRFGDNGSDSGEQLVNSIRLGDQTTPAISMTPSGGSVTVWQGPSSYGVGQDVFAHVILGSKTQPTTNNSGPTLSKVVVVEENAATRDGTLSSSDVLALTWNAADANGVAGATLRIDGVLVSKVYGPYADGSGGYNYSASLGTLAAGSHTYRITATDTLGALKEISGSFTVVSSALDRDTTPIGPTISSLAMAAGGANPYVSWNLVDSDGIASATITIDGKSASVNGPYSANNGGWNYSASIASLASGSHTYVITAIDKKGNKSQSNGTFVVPSAAAVTNVGPTISGVSTAAGIANPFVSWNLVDSDGVASTTIKIDGKSTAINGPYVANNGGWNYSAGITSLSAGSHSYTITATDKKGVTTSSTGTFTIPGATIGTNAGPVISGLSTATGVANPFVSWNLIDSDGVANTTITIDGKSAPVYGPYAASSGGWNYSTGIASLSAGSHNYTITATDKKGVTTTSTGTFQIAGSALPGNSKPVIGGVVTNTADSSPVVTWNVVDADGIASTSVQLNGKSVSGVFGPYAATNGGFNYGASLKGLAAGTYTFVISAQDKLGNIQTYSNSLTMPGTSGGISTSNVGPSINSIVPVTRGASPLISWNLLDSDGIASTSITVDSKRLTRQYGPYAATNGGSNYSADLVGLSTGTHTYVITATDKKGVTTQKTGTFTIESSVSSASQAVFSNLGASDTTATTSAKVQWLYGG